LGLISDPPGSFGYYFRERHLVMKISLILSTAFLLSAGSLFAQPMQVDIFEQLRAPGAARVNIQQDARIEALVKRHVQRNAQKKGIDGFRVQIFLGTGSEARNKARAVQSQFLSSFPGIKTYLLYHEPYFKVRVGDFRTRNEAYRVYRQISAQFPDAFIVSESETQFPDLP
jgi:hypothetical protein